MARKRLNKKVAVFGFILFVIIILAGIILFLGMSRDPEKYTADAEGVITKARESSDEKEKEKLYGQAEGLYAKARDYTKGDDKKIENLFTVAEMYMEAGNWPKVTAYWSNISSIDKNNVKAQMGMLKFYSIIAFSGGDRYWQEIMDRSSILLEIVENAGLSSEDMAKSDYPKNLESPVQAKKLGTYLHLLRGISGVRVASRGSASDVETSFSNAFDDLKKVISQEPENVDGYFYLAQGRIVHGDLMATGGDIEARDVEYGLAEKLLAESVKNAGGSVESHLNQLEMKTDSFVMKAGKTTDDQERKKIKSQILSVEQDYHDIIKQFPSSDKAYLKLSRYYSQLDVILESGDFDRAENLNKAIIAAEKSVELNDSKLECRNNLSGLLYLRYSRYGQKPDLLRCIEITEKSLDTPEAVETTGPRRWANTQNRLSCYTLLANSYLDLTLNSKTGSGRGGYDEQMMAKAEESVHNIEQIMGSGDNPMVIKWRGMIEFAKGNRDDAIRYLYKVYEQYKATDERDARLCYTLAELFRDSPEQGAYMEYLNAAVASGLSRTKPEVLLEYAEAFMKLGQADQAHNVANYYEITFAPDEKSRNLKIRSLIGTNLSESEKEISKLPAEDPRTMKLNLELIEAKVRNLVYTQQQQLAEKVSSPEPGKLTQEQESQKAAIQEEIKSLSRNYTEIVEKLITREASLVEEGSVISACDYYISEGKKDKAASLMDVYLKQFPDKTQILLSKQYLAESDPLNISVERRKEIGEQVLLSISVPELRSLSLGVLYWQNEEIDKAKAEFLKVVDPGSFEKSVKPDEVTDNQRQAIGYLFEIALSQKRMEEVDSILQLSRRMNIDRCEGNYFAARVAVAKEEYDEALNRINSALELRPVFFGAYLTRGQINAQLGNTEAVIEDARKAVSLNPLDGNAAAFLAYYLDKQVKQLDKVARAEQILEAKNAIARAISRNSGQTRYQLVSIYTDYQREEDPWSAIAILQQLMAESPSSEVALKLGVLAYQLASSQTDEKTKKALFGIAESSFEKGLAVDPGNKALTFEFAQYYKASGQPDKANRLLEDAQDQELILLNCLQSGDIPGAKAILDKLYQDNPKDVMTLKRLVFVAERSGDKQAVQKYSEELLSVEDNVLNRLSQIQNFLKAGLVAEAQKKLDSYKEKYPDERKSDALLLEAWVAKDQGKLEKALDLTNQSLGINPDNATGLSLRGEIEMSLGEYSQAISDLRSSYSKSQDVDTRIKLAYAYYRGQRNEDAISELVSIIKGPQENVGARTLLEGIYYKLGRVKELSGLYEETLQKYPNDLTWHKKAGAFALKNGQFEKAENLFRQSWENSQEKDPASLDGYFNTLTKSRKWTRVLEEARKYTDGDLGFIAYLRMAEARIGLGDRPSATGLFNKAIEKAGSNEEVLELVLQRISGLLSEEEVTAFCEGILRASPNSLAANFTMYNLTKLKGEYNNSANYIDKCISSVEAGSPQWINLTAKKAMLMQSAYQKTSDNNYLDKSVSLYKSLLEKLPNSTGVLNNLAYLLVEDDKRIDEALEYAKVAYNQDRNNPNVMDTYGYILLKKGEIGKAEEMIQAAMQQYERDNVSASWDVYEHLGMVKEALKTEQGSIQAVEAYKKAIETGSGQMPDQAKKRIDEAVKRLSR